LGVIAVLAGPEYRGAGGISGIARARRRNIHTATARHLGTCGRSGTIGRVLTIGMGPVLIAAICGPILGGWLTDSFGWQSIFLINIPIGLLALVAAGLVLPEDDPSPAESLDIIGMSLLSAGVVLLLCGVSPLAGRGTIAGANAWFPATVGLVLLGAFVIHALRRADARRSICGY
jgi:MFS family permease